MTDSKYFTTTKKGERFSPNNRAFLAAEYGGRGGLSLPWDAGEGASSRGNALSPWGMLWVTAHPLLRGLGAPRHQPLNPGGAMGCWVIGFGSSGAAAGHDPPLLSSPGLGQKRLRGST